MEQRVNGDNAACTTYLIVLVELACIAAWERRQVKPPLANRLKVFARQPQQRGMAALLWK